MGTKTFSHIVSMIRNSLPEIINELTTLCSFKLTYFGPFGATQDIGGAQYVPPISYACSICAILINLPKINRDQ